MALIKIKHTLTQILDTHISPQWFSQRIVKLYSQDIEYLVCTEPHAKEMVTKARFLPSRSSVADRGNKTVPRWLCYKAGYDEYHGGAAIWRKDRKKLILGRVILEVLMKEATFELHFKAQMNFQKIPMERRLRSLWKREMHGKGEVWRVSHVFRVWRRLGHWQRPQPAGLQGVTRWESLVSHMGLELWGCLGPFSQLISSVAASLKAFQDCLSLLFGNLAYGEYRQRVIWDAWCLLN